jgi:hypothetical protein
MIVSRQTLLAWAVAPVLHPMRPQGTEAHLHFSRTEQGYVLRLVSVAPPGFCLAHNAPHGLHSCAAPQVVKGRSSTVGQTAERPQIAGSLAYFAAVIATFFRAVVNSGRSSPTEIWINSWKYRLATLGFPPSSAALPAPYNALNRLGAIFKTAS